MSVVPVLIITLRNTLRILGKAFIVGGAVFYSYDKGIWSSGEHSENHAKLIKKQAEESIVSNIPFHKLPTADDIKISWNDSMHTVFTTLDETPGNVAKLTEEVKNFIVAPPRDV